MALKRFTILLGLLLSTTPYLLAQSTVSIGILPEVMVEYKAAEKWTFGFNAESMQQTTLWQNEDRIEGYEYIRTDLTVTAATRLTARLKSGSGYMHRLRENGPVHRWLQQVSWSTRLPVGRMAQRLRVDGTYSDGHSPLYRLRYRVGVDIPLQGVRVDDGEYYLSTTFEQLGEFQSGDPDTESRLVLNIGRDINPGATIELGLDNRVDRYLNNESGRLRSWVTFALAVGI